MYLFYLYIFEGSTLGYMIMSLSGKPLPLINHGVDDPIEGFSPHHCFITSSNEPCCHSCGLMVSPEVFNVTYDHVLTTCVDFPGGLKLIS